MRHHKQIFIVPQPAWTKRFLLIGSSSGTAVRKQRPQPGTEGCTPFVRIYEASVSHQGPKGRDCSRPEGRTQGHCKEAPGSVLPVAIVDGFWLLDCWGPKYSGCREDHNNRRCWERNLILHAPLTRSGFPVCGRPSLCKSFWTSPYFLCTDKQFRRPFRSILR